MSAIDLDQLYFAIVDGNAKAAVAVTKDAVAANVAPQTLLADYMIPAMDEVGARFESNECFVPELLISARAMKAALEVVRPLLVGQAAEPAGRVVVATVQGDLHDIGKNLVATMLEGGGFEIVDIGTDVSPDKLADAVHAHQPQIVALSALLTTTLPAMKRMIDRLTQEGLRDRVKVMIGGAPVTQDFADEIGADGYNDNAAGAVGVGLYKTGQAMLSLGTSGVYFAVSDGKLIINFNNPRIDGTLLYNGPAGAVRVGRIATFEAGFVLVLLTLFVVLNLINSRSGRAIMASRDNRIAAEAMGVNVTKYKLMAFVTSAALAGMAGALFGLNFSSIAPDKFKFDTSILVLVFVVLGGIGNIRGSVIAAALLTVLPEVLREFGDYRMLIYAIVLIAVMLLGNAPVVRQVFERIRPAKKEVVKEGDAA